MTDKRAPWLTFAQVGPISEESVKRPEIAMHVNEPLVNVLKATQVSLKHLTMPSSGDKFSVSLGVGKNALGQVLWKAGAGISTVTGNTGVVGISNWQLASYRQGLNMWLDIPNQQQGLIFRNSLSRENIRLRVLDSLLALPMQYYPRLSVSATVSNRSALKTEFPEIHKSHTEVGPAFKDTIVNQENRPLLLRLLEIYSENSKQTFLSIKMFLPPSIYKLPEVEAAQDIKPMLEALDGLAGFLTSVSTLDIPNVFESSETNVYNFSKTTKELSELTKYTKNIILYGPPGTGKTYSVQEFQKFIAQNAEPLPPQDYDITKLPRWQVIALTLYANTDAMSVNSMLQEQPLSRFEAVKGGKSPYASVMTELVERGVKESGELVNNQYQRSPSVFLKQPNKTWTLSDVGMQYVKENLITQPAADWSRSPEARTRFITFHPSFAYEEFVEGLRPVIEGGQLQYKVQNGIFKSICGDAEKELHLAKAAGRAPRPFLLVIDEINRANIAKVFGELMTLIEDDKRVSVDGSGLRVMLPYSGELFGVPENLTIIGTMNTADRSIALLDLALRRRFTFLEVLPDADAIRATSGDNGVIEGIDIANLLNSLNKTITQMLDRDHQLGHSYLTGIKRGLLELHFRWYRKVIPLLQEYFYNDGEKLERVLGEAFITLGDRIGGPGGRRSYDIQYLDGPAFTTAIKALTGVSSITATVMDDD